MIGAVWRLNNSNAIIQVGNYKEILLENAREGDFIYLDPPYNPTSSTSYFTKYTHTGFNNKDQEEHATVFRKLDDRRCKVLLSNSDTQFIKELYSGFAKYMRLGHNFMFSFCYNMNSSMVVFLSTILYWLVTCSIPKLRPCHSQICLPDLYIWIQYY